MSISALNNIKIEFEDHVWRLSHDDVGTLATANQDGLMFAPEYAMRQRMPQQLSNGLISRVVLGWSDADLAWHLGVLISQDVADWRGNRWCALARWDELETPEAREASEALAKALGRKLRVIPPKNIVFGADEQTVITPTEHQTPSAEEISHTFPEVELPALPLSVSDDWRFESKAGGYQYTRTKKWFYSRWMNFLWYAFWAGAFLTLSIASLTVDLALPNTAIINMNPELLPYLGIAAGLLILFLALEVLMDILSAPNRIIIDSAQRSIRVLRNNTEKWRLKSVDIDSIYVSQVLQKRRRNKTTVEHAELNIYTTRGEFKRLLMADNEIEYSNGTQKSLDNQVIPLAEATTPLQASALYAAKALEITSWYDQRI